MAWWLTHMGLEAGSSLGSGLGILRGRCRQGPSEGRQGRFVGLEPVEIPVASIGSPHRQGDIGFECHTPPICFGFSCLLVSATDRPSSLAFWRSRRGGSFATMSESVADRAR